MTQTTLERIHKLEQSRRRWKLVALIALTSLTLILLSAVGSTVALRQRALAEQARAEQALHEAQEQKDQSERVRQFLEEDLLKKAPEK